MPVQESTRLSSASKARTLGFAGLPVFSILSGCGTITEPDGNSFDIGPGTLFVTPAGWESR
jgi:uncharacterized cupin superfamily protein